MSIELMTLVWKVPFPTSTQMVIALKLADHAKDDGSDIFPGRASLADRARCSESTVKATLKLFREAGILLVVEQGGKGPHDTTVYRMHVELLKAIAAGEISISGSSNELLVACGNHVDEKGSNSDPLEKYPVSPQAVRGQPAGSKGSAHNPQTITNHQEPSLRAKRAQSESFKSGFGSEVKPSGTITITTKDHPQAVEAWRRYALHREGHAYRQIVKLIDKHGACAVPTLMPPDETLTEKSRRMAGEAA